MGYDMNRDMRNLLLPTVVVFGLLGMGVLFVSFMESHTYNRLTGADTTWWDALCVDLRVVDTPIRSPSDER